jgi:hypothetical protein
MSVQIGKANFEGNKGGTLGGLNWFYIEDNKPNVYRVLPPLKSLAALGKYAKYYRVHRNLRGSDGKQKPFICVEEMDMKTKIITRHCPLCDRVRELEANLKQAEMAGASKEQLKEMRMKVIFPLQNEGKYYLNVVNQEGRMGVIAIGSKHFQAFQALAKELDKTGLDVTGMQGIYLNFKKTTQFKGDKQAVLQVEPYLAAGADGSFRYVTHEITQDVMNRLERETADLGNLFKQLSVEQIAAILTFEGEARAKYMDSLFAAPEKEPQQGGTVPGTNVQLVGNVTAAPQGGFQVNTPSLPPQQPVQAPNNFGQFSGTQNINTGMGPMGGMIKTTESAPQVQPVAQSSQGALPGLVTMGALSDADFLEMMKKR